MDQAEVIACLEAPTSHGGVAVQRIDTHASVVFLAGPRAWKLKRAVRYDYLDFSTVERRRAACEAEVRLNRRTAPALYHGVVAVTRELDGRLRLGGGGVPVDWVIEMGRFDQEALLDRQAARGALAFDLMEPLAAAIARFHRDAEVRHDHGGAAAMTWVVEGNRAGFAEHGAGVLPPDRCAALTDASLAAIDRLRARIEARRDGGFVRHCHGDLHLRNIVVLDGAPTLFDAVEFNDELACIDVWYDLAFLLMDLWQHRLPLHAHAVFNDYLAATGDAAGLALLPLYLSCRAAVRAKVAATAARLQADGAARAAQEALARDYLAMAARLLGPPAAALLAVGGLSGSGKSTLARALAPRVGPVPGACLVRNDVVRKALAGVSPLTRLGPEHYTAEVSARVYSTVAERAALALRAGHTVVVDGVFARASDREAIARVAADCGVPFAGIWLDAPAETLLARARARQRDASDADEAVVRAQLSQAIGSQAWHRVDASGTPESALREALALLARVRPESLREDDGDTSRALKVD